MRVLVTAFEAYDGAENASRILLDSLADEPLPGPPREFATASLPCDTGRIEAALGEVLDRLRPRFLVLFGQAPGSTRVRLETRAVNLRRFSIPDTGGHRIQDGVVVEGGPPELASSLPDLPGILARLHEAEIPAGLSDDAGTYLCNQSLYLALHRGPRRDPPLATVFVHLPLHPRQVVRERPEHPSMALSLTRRALAVILDALDG